MVTALAASSLGFGVGNEEAALVGWRAENEFVGMNCGVMDQYAVSLSGEGHLMLLDCRTLHYEHIPFNLPGAYPLTWAGWPISTRRSPVTSLSFRPRGRERAPAGWHESPTGQARLGNVTCRHMPRIQAIPPQAAGT